MELKEEKLHVWLENIKLKKSRILDKDCVQRDQRETVTVEGESFRKIQVRLVY